MNFNFIARPLRQLQTFVRRKRHLSKSYVDIDNNFVDKSKNDNDDLDFIDYIDLIQIGIEFFKKLDEIDRKGD